MVVFYGPDIGGIVTTTVWEDPLEKEMAAHSSTLAWKIPWTQERGRLQSMGLQRVAHDFTFTFTVWEAKQGFSEMILSANGDKFH